MSSAENWADSTEDYTGCTAKLYVIKAMRKGASCVAVFHRGADGK